MGARVTRSLLKSEHNVLQEIAEATLLTEGFTVFAEGTDAQRKRLPCTGMARPAPKSATLTSAQDILRRSGIGLSLGIAMCALVNAA